MTTREAFRQIRRAMWERSMVYDKDHYPATYRAADIETVACWLVDVEKDAHLPVSERDVIAVAEAWSRLTLGEGRGNRWRMTDEQRRQLLA